MDDIGLFKKQIYDAWPNLSKDQIVAYAHDRNHEDKAIQAMDVLTRQGLPWAFVCAMRHPINRTDPFDITIDSAMHAARKFDPERGCLSTLIDAVVRSKTCDMIRSRKSKKQLIQNCMPLIEDIVDDQDHGYHDVYEKERKYMHRVLSMIPERERDIIKLRIDGYSSRERGYILGESRGSIHYLDKRAIACLRSFARLVLCYSDLAP